MDRKAVRPNENYYYSPGSIVSTPDLFGPALRPKPLNLDYNFHPLASLERKQSHLEAQWNQYKASQCSSKLASTPNSRVMRRNQRTGFPQFPRFGSCEKEPVQRAPEFRQMLFEEHFPSHQRDLEISTLMSEKKNLELELDNLKQSKTNFPGIQELKSQMEQDRNTIQDLQTQVSGLVQKKDTTENKPGYALISSKYEEKIKKLEETKDAKIQALNSQINQLKARNGVFKAPDTLVLKVKEIKKENLKFRKELQQLSKETTDELTTLIKRAAGNNQKHLAVENRKQKNKIQSLQEEIDKLRSENSELKASNELITEAVEELTERFNELESSQGKGYQEHYELLQHEIQLRDNLLTAAKSSEQQYKSEIQFLSNKLLASEETSKSRETELLNQLTALDTQLEKFSSQNHDLTQKLAGKDKEISALKEIAQNESKNHHYEIKIQDMESKEQKLLSEQLKTMEKLQQVHAASLEAREKSHRSEQSKQESELYIEEIKDANSQLQDKLHASTNTINELKAEITRLNKSHNKLENENLELLLMSKSSVVNQELQQSYASLTEKHQDVLTKLRLERAKTQELTSQLGHLGSALQPNLRDSEVLSSDIDELNQIPDFNYYIEHT